MGEPELGLAQGAVDLAQLTARIRAEFPALWFERAALNDAGQDHAVVMLDAAWVFRFPRSQEAARYAAAERRLLEQLAPVSNLAVPRYELVSASGDFGGYRMIVGEALTPARFAGLAGRVQMRLLDEMGAFLRILHGLPASLGAEGPRSWSGEDYAARFAKRRDEIFAPILGQPLLARADAFFNALPNAVHTDIRRLVHNDFTDDHILVAPDGERLAGVIDFTDASVGDPAFDFTFLWAYGNEAPARALAAYDASDLAAGVLARSRWWWVRYSLDQLWWNAMGNRSYDPAAILARLPADFYALGV